MSVKSQENNMRRLATLLGGNLSYIYGDRECGPNGNKATFLHLGKVFLRALAKDLGLRDVRVTSNAGGIAVSGECYLYGLWEDGGIHICLSQFCDGKDVLLYRTIRTLNDHKGGYNHYITRRELETCSYQELLNTLSAVRKDTVGYGWAA